MPAYGALRNVGRNEKKTLNKIVIHMPSEETGGQHVFEHHWANQAIPDRYEFLKEQGPEMVRHLEASIGMRDLAAPQAGEEKGIFPRSGPVGSVSEKINGRT